MYQSLGQWGILISCQVYKLKTYLIIVLIGCVLKFMI